MRVLLLSTTSAEKWGNRFLLMGSMGFKSYGEKEWGNGFLSFTDRITVSTPSKSSALQQSSSKISSTKFLNQHWLLAIEEESVPFSWVMVSPDYCLFRSSRWSISIVVSFIVAFPKINISHIVLLQVMFQVRTFLPNY